MPPRANNFETFFAARQTALLLLIQDATGKAALAEITDPEPVVEEAATEELFLQSTEQLVNIT